ncbi:PAS domain-containing protein [Altererythrobacter sp. Root672]|uniref:PAS domain-containing protein n=1 Tax=Altererythrobacter sp. Root672 TaxID=1736584 RepID=UPI00070099BA|nr:PAS domain-containing protein [Altererythrobacter sp. Root672]KRA84005.1 hypothetical protein ASD76_08375 [Altererythrobacter sp. Root672]
MCDANFSPIFLNRTGRDLVGLPRDADIESLKFTDFFVPESQAIIDDIVFPTVIRARRWKGELKVRHFADATQNKAVPWSIFGIFGPDGEFIGGGCIASDISALEHSQSERLDEKPRRSSMTPEYLAGQRGLHGDRTMSVENLLVLTGEEPEPEDCDGTAARLRLYEAKLREASDLFGLAVYSWNPVSDALEWDDRLRAMWGLPAGEPVDRLAFEAGIHPDDRERVDQAITACLDPSGDGRYDIEYRVIGRDDGVERYVSTSGQTTFEQGKATAFIGAVVDVSENRRAEASIRASEARFRAFAEYSANLLWIINPVSNMIEYRSPAYERIWGEPIQDAPKGLDDWLARIHPDDLQSVCAALESVKAGELILHEYRIIRPDGSVRWLRDTSFPIRGDVGQVPRIGGIIEDLTLYDGNHVYTLGKPGAEFGRLTNMLRGAGFQVRSFESTSALIDIAPVLTPGCVLIDLRMKATDGMQIPRELKARAVTLPTVVIGPEIADPDSIIAAMKAGASDYLIPPFEDDRLKAAVASAMAEMHGLGRIHSTAMESATRVARLTVREREVLEGLVKGGTNKTIAKELGISPRTVELYRSQVMNRLDASDLPELIQIALAAGVRPRSEVNRPAARSARNPT